MALATMIQDLADKRAAYEAALKEHSAQKDEIVRALAADIPPGYALTWTQGTPSFNDGEPCVFRVHDLMISPTDNPDKKIDFGTFIDGYGKPDEVVETWRCRYDVRTGANVKETYSDVIRGYPAVEGFTTERLEKLLTAWTSIPRDLHKAAFGDNSRTTIYPDGLCVRGSYRS